MALPSTPPPDLPSSAAATTTTTATAATTSTTNPPTVRRFQNPPLLARPQSQQPHYHHPQPNTYPLPSPHFYTTQPMPNLAPRQPTTSIRSQSPAKPHEPSPGILYPVASSGRGFLTKAIRPQSVDQTVTVANPGGIPPRPVAYAHHHPVRPYGFPPHDPHGQGVHHIRPTHLQHSLMGSAGGAMPGVVRGVPVSVSVHQKVAPSHPPVSESNGFKDMRDRSKDDGLVTVRHRKVRISESSSLYALCRSWLRNGLHEENQPHYVDGVRSLPRPSPALVVDGHLPVEKGGDKEEDEEEEGPVEHLSPAELLQRHTNRAKRVRAGLREGRLQRIARYKSRLALLLPPLTELKNEAATSN